LGLGGTSNPLRESRQILVAKGTVYLMRLYDQYGRPIPETHTSKPRDEDQFNKPEKRAVIAITPVPNFWRLSKKGLARLVVAIGVVASFLTFYQLRPKSAPNGPVLPEDSDPRSPKFTFSNSGDITMRHVEAQCEYSKVIFGRQYTLNIGRTVVASMYRVPDVAPNERFAVSCPVSWNILTSVDRTRGAITIGSFIPEGNAKLVAAYTILPNGDINILPPTNPSGIANKRLPGTTRD
jgi:hypothetical protein